MHWIWCGNRDLPLCVPCEQEIGFVVVHPMTSDLQFNKVRHQEIFLEHIVHLFSWLTSIGREDCAHKLSIAPLPRFLMISTGDFPHGNSYRMCIDLMPMLLLLSSFSTEVNMDGWLANWKHSKRYVKGAMICEDTIYKLNGGVCVQVLLDQTNCLLTQRTHDKSWICIVCVYIYTPGREGTEESKCSIHASLSSIHSKEFKVHIGLHLI